MSRFRFGNLSWRLLALAMAAIYIALIAYSTWLPPAKETALGHLLADFQGNLIAGFIANLIFLVFAVILDSKTSEKIEEIEVLTKRREAQFEREQRIAHFEEFMKVQNWHDVRFPNLKFQENSLGVEYTIRPVRDSASGPKSRKSEMRSFWLIEVIRPANEEVLPPDILAEYQKSPIREGEFYYCSFFNESWHMSLDGVRDWHEFYMSGKVGPVEYGVSANAFMGFNAEPEGMKMAVPQFPLVHVDGSELRRGQSVGCDMYKIYVDAQGSLFLKIDDSPLKQIYMTNPPNTVGDIDYFFKIENLRGYGDEQKRTNIAHAVRSRLEQANISIPKIPWHRFPA